MSDTTRSTRRSTPASARAGALLAALLTLASAGAALPQTGDEAQPTQAEAGGDQPVPPEAGPEQPAPPAAGGQQQEPEPLPPIDLRPPFGAPEDPQAELKRLFGEVETHLRRIDELLWDASTGEDALGADVDSGISKLLQDSRESSRQASDSITRILQIAQSQSSGSSSGSLGPPPPPQDQGGDPGEQQRQDGELPDKPEGAKPEGSQPEGDQPGGEQPKQGDQEQEGADANQAAGAPDSGELAPVGHGDEAERWGELPLRVREVFRAEGSEEMPSRYRDWIDTYYRRLGQDR